jgi:cyanate permease
MSYLASIYLAALALFGALVVWALPSLLAAFVEWARTKARTRKLRAAGRPTHKPALPALRTSEISLH